MDKTTNASDSPLGEPGLVSGKWPLSFSLKIPQHQQTNPGTGKHTAKRCWWSHRLYRGPSNRPVQILYSKTIQDSEKLARRFLEQDIVGFDMEWPWNDWKRSDLQNKIGLIQVATESEIALFHIGLHSGKTTKDIIAPSLKQLIEDPKIGKVGVGILNADFARLKRFFSLKPQGAVELSHLYRLVKFGASKPELVSTKLVSLARLVEDQLGYPLYKGDVRTSNWSRALSKDQINYAAADAYAGFMLYRCMDYKRLQMTPVPPLPVHAEKYLGYRLSGVIPLVLDSQSEDGTMMTSETFFGVKIDPDTAPSNNQKTKQPATAKPKFPKELTDEASQQLYLDLSVRRATLAVEKGVQAYRISTNAVLVALAIQRPTNAEQLLEIKGIGKQHQKNFGSAWLEVIGRSVTQEDCSENSKLTEEVKEISMASLDQVSGQCLDNSSSTRSRVKLPSSSNSSCAFTTLPSKTPQLHTGLSFALSETQLGAETDDAAYISDGSLPSLDFGDTSPLKKSALKRKRSGSLLEEQGNTGSPDIQPVCANVCEPSSRIPVTQAHESETGSTTSPVQTLSPKLKIARNKLLALSKLVTRKLGSRPKEAPPIVSDRTISLIVLRTPQTQEDLERIPGIDAFLLACHKTNTDLLRNIVKITAPTS